MSEPKPRDRVRVVLEGEYGHDRSGEPTITIMVEATGEVFEVPIHPAATIEPTVPVGDAATGRDAVVEQAAEFIWDYIHGNWGAYEDVQEMAAGLAERGLLATPPVASTPDTELRERYARAIARAMWGAAVNRCDPMPIDWSAADAVMAERDTEVERLTAELAKRTRERDLAIAHDRQPYPTAWAYEQACAALHRKEAELAALRAGRDLALWLHAEQTWRYNVVLRDCAEAQTAEDVAIEEGRGYLTRSRELASQLAALRAQQQDMVRYRLAWESAKRRARGHWEAATWIRDERDAAERQRE